MSILNVELKEMNLLCDRSTRRRFGKDENVIGIESNKFPLKFRCSRFVSVWKVDGDRILIPL